MINTAKCGKEINPREFYTMEWTNEYSSPYQPKWSGSNNFKGTPKKIRTEIQRIRRGHGTSWFDYRIKNRCGKEIRNKMEEYWVEEDFEVE